MCTSRRPLPTNIPNGEVLRYQFCTVTRRQSFVPSDTWLSDPFPQLNEYKKFVGIESFARDCTLIVVAKRFETSATSLRLAMSSLDYRLPLAIATRGVFNLRHRVRGIPSCGGGGGFWGTPIVNGDWAEEPRIPAPWASSLGADQMENYQSSSPITHHVSLISFDAM